MFQSQIVVFKEIVVSGETLYQLFDLDPLNELNLAPASIIDELELYKLLSIE